VEAALDAADHASKAKKSKSPPPEPARPKDPESELDSLKEMLAEKQRELDAATDPAAIADMQKELTILARWIDDREGKTQEEPPPVPPEEQEPAPPPPEPDFPEAPAPPPEEAPAPPGPEAPSGPPASFAPPEPAAPPRASAPAPTGLPQSFGPPQPAEEPVSPPARARSRSRSRSPRAPDGDAAARALESPTKAAEDPSATAAPAREPPPSVPRAPSMAEIAATIARAKRSPAIATASALAEEYFMLPSVGRKIAPAKLPVWCVIPDPEDIEEGVEILRRTTGNKQPPTRLLFGKRSWIMFGRRLDPGLSQGQQEPDIGLATPRASRQHAMAMRNWTGQVFIMDLGSPNGTIMGNKVLRKLEPVRWNVGSSVYFADAKTEVFELRPAG